MKSAQLILVAITALSINLTAAGGFAAPPNKSGNTISPTQNWDTVLPADQRFTVLTGFNNQAVRDNETGLVWERSPETSPRTWEDAVRTCWLRQVGGRAGWHLPTIEELASLVDPTVPAPGPALPPGHPFQNVQQSAYWSTTTDVRVEFLPNHAWEVRLHIPFGVHGIIGDTDKSSSGFVWCVRGGTHEDKYK